MRPSSHFNRADRKVEKTSYIGRYIGDSKTSLLFFL